ncbi:hypothetical protein CSOJ01_01356 [Colletotrichum sojae]|uniref:Uncharacterized protein n=1 Tax=Colletotrichum sojae TaxID=2175907 RepID=A0A8H6JTZ1_9PEZI|nr:hypothetical protein CSOJ01_01356 [Colletotrichum sojae]
MGIPRHRSWRQDQRRRGEHVPPFFSLRPSAPQSALFQRAQNSAQHRRPGPVAIITRSPAPDSLASTTRRCSTCWIIYYQQQQQQQQQERMQLAAQRISVAGSGAPGRYHPIIGYFLVPKWASVGAWVERQGHDPGRLFRRLHLDQKFKRPSACHPSPANPSRSLASSLLNMSRSSVSSMPPLPPPAHPSRTIARGVDSLWIISLLAWMIRPDRPPSVSNVSIGTSPAELTADTSTEGRSSPESTNKRPQPEPAHPCVPSRTPALADLGATVLATLRCGNRPKRKSRTGSVNLPSPSCRRVPVHHDIDGLYAADEQPTLWMKQPADEAAQHSSSGSGSGSGSNRNQIPEERTTGALRGEADRSFLDVSCGPSHSSSRGP